MISFLLTQRQFIIMRLIKPIKVWLTLKLRVLNLRFLFCYTTFGTHYLINNAILQTKYDKFMYHSKQFALKNLALYKAKIKQIVCFLFHSPNN